MARSPATTLAELVAFSGASEHPAARRPVSPRTPSPDPDRNPVRCQSSRSATSTSQAGDKQILKGLDLTVDARRGPRADGPQRLRQVDARQRDHGQPGARGHRGADPASAGEDITEARPRRARAPGPLHGLPVPRRHPGRDDHEVPAHGHERPPRRARRGRGLAQGVPQASSRRRWSSRTSRRTSPRATSTRASRAARRSAWRCSSSRCSSPQVAVLDETDSGLDIDALNVVANGVNTVRAGSDMGVLIITHYQRILHLVEPTRVSIMFDGPDRQGGRPGARRRSSSARATAGSATRSPRRPDGHPAPPTALAHEFPVLDREGLVYLDSGATSQKPRVGHRRDRGLLRRATTRTSTAASTRSRSRRPSSSRAPASGSRPGSASTTQETVFTKNATEAINLVAYAWGRRNVGAGDAIVLTQLEHHSNIVPWQLLCQEAGAELRYLEVGDEGDDRPRPARRATSPTAA